MLTAEDIELLAKQIALCRTQRNPIFAWVMGLSGAGKTFVVEHLARTLRQQWTVSVLSDRSFLFAEVIADYEQLHHVEAEGEWIITDSAIHDVASDKLLAAVQASTEDCILIELGRGIDRRGVVNFGYGRFLPKVPVDVLNNSVFFYLACPYEERARRNLQRPMTGTGNGGGYRLPLFVMENYHRHDDIQDWVGYLGLRLVIVDNP